MKAICVTLLALAMAWAWAATATAANLSTIQTVFVIVMENEDWAAMVGSPSAPYLNETVLPMASYCDAYYNPPGNHPSLPNYLWLEAGTNFGIADDQGPTVDSQATTNHLVSLLARAGISWRTYQEDIAAGYVPLADTNNYIVHHNPYAYFDDVTGTNNPADPYGIAHIRPYTELAADLANHQVARYNFITPNRIDDGHDAGAPDYNPIQQTDDWLATELPKILGSAAYTNDGAIFIVWDEDDAVVPAGSPIGMIVLSPLARGGGYANHIYYTHSSTLRTFQEIFGIAPLLGDAVNAVDLGDLFTPYNIAVTGIGVNGGVQLQATGVRPGSTNFIQTSSDLTRWQTISTNVSPGTGFTFTDISATNGPARFYRLAAWP